MFDKSNFKNLVNTLINKGKEKGFLTYDEIDAILDSGMDEKRELSEEEVEQLYDILEEKSIEIVSNTDEAENYNNLGLIYYENNDLIQAKEHFDMALSMKHDFSDAHLNLALIYRDEKNILKSLRHLKLCIKYSKDDELLERAKEHIKNIEEGSYKEDTGKADTVRLDGEILDYKPEKLPEPSYEHSDELDNLIKLARTCKDKGHIEQSLDYYRKILTLAPNEGTYYLDIALICKEEHRYEEALQYLKECAKKATNIELLSEAKNYISLIEHITLQRDNKIEESTMNIEEKIKTCELLLSETDSDITKSGLYIKLAGFYKEIKDFNRAVSYYKDYLKINKNDGKIHMETALLYREQKNIFHALKHFRCCVKRTEDEHIKKEAEAFIKEIEDFQ